MWQESILLLGIALVLAIVIKTFFVQAFYIPSESMEPGLIRNDRILVQKVSYWFGGDPSRGDVVVFEDPGGWLTGEEPKPTGLASLLSKVGLYPTGGHLVKRVIGTEGDVIECCDDEGRILVNGEPIDESKYIAKRKTVRRRQGHRLRLRLVGGPGTGRQALRARRQPRCVRGLPRHMCQPGRRDLHPEPVGRHRPGGRQGLLAGLAAGPLGLDQQPRRLRRRARRPAGRRLSLTAMRCRRCRGD